MYPIQKLTLHLCTYLTSSANLKAIGHINSPEEEREMSHLRLR
jgi:hypothetical protein